jgi:WD40 repeat protein
VNALAFRPGGRILATGGGGGQGHAPELTLWDVSTGTALVTLTTPKGLRGIAFSPDGNLLAVGGGNGAITLWDVSRLPKPKPEE